MQPQSNGNLVDRIIAWWRGLFGGSPGSSGSAPSDTSRTLGSRSDAPAESGSADSGAGSVLDRARESAGGAAGTIQERVDRVTGTIREQVKDLKKGLDDSGTSAEGDTSTSTDTSGVSSQTDLGNVAGATGASYDEFSTGGYTGEATDQADVAAAAGEDTGASSWGQGDLGSDQGETEEVPEFEPGDTDYSGSLEDQPTDTSYASTGNYGSGNLGLGAQGSLGYAGSTETETAEPETGVEDESTTESGTGDAGATVDSGPAGQGDAIESSAGDSGILTGATSGGTWQGETGGYGTSDAAAETGESHGLPGTTASEASSTAEEQVSAGVSDLGASELGTLESVEDEVETGSITYGDTEASSAGDTVAGYDADTASGVGGDPLAEAGTDLESETGAPDPLGLFGGPSEVETTDLSYIDDVDNSRFEFEPGDTGAESASTDSPGAYASTYGSSREAPDASAYGSEAPATAFPDESGAASGAGATDASELESGDYVDSAASVGTSDEPTDLGASGDEGYGETGLTSEGGTADLGGVTEDGEATFGSTDVTTDSETTVGAGDLTGEGEASGVSIDGESTFGTTDVTSDTDTLAARDDETAGAPVYTTTDDDPTASEFDEATYTGADSEAEEAELERAGYSIETPGLEDTDTSAGLADTVAGLEGDQITTSPDLPGTEDVGLLESPETASAEDIATDTGDETSSAAVGGTGGFNADDDVVTGSGFEGTQYYGDTPADAGWESASATTEPGFGATGYADVDAGDTGESLDSSAAADGTDTAVVAGAAAASTTEGAVGGRIKGDASGSCPPDYPIKGNGSSKIYHVPGIPSYRGTKAEWCFASEEVAIEAGFRAPGGHRAAAGRGSSGPAASGGGSDEPESDAGLDAPLSADTGPTTLAAAASDSDASYDPYRASYPQEADAGTTGAATSEGDDFGSGTDDIESLQLSSPDDTTGSSANVTDSIPSGGVATERDESFEVNTVTSTSADADTAEYNDQGAYAGAVRGDGTRVCPSDHPIKGNATSMIYHSPGRASYESTIAEWCFADEAAAEAAGFRAPKR